MSFPDFITTISATFALHSEMQFHMSGAAQAVHAHTVCCLVAGSGKELGQGWAVVLLLLTDTPALEC